MPILTHPTGHRIFIYQLIQRKWLAILLAAWHRALVRAAQ
jgi:hypothetical protein